MMAENTPMEYATYPEYQEGSTVADPLKEEKDYSFKIKNMKERLFNATPCAVGHQDCFDQVMRLAYLNQQSDQGSLGLRRGRACLNQYELDQIADINTRENHPLNCAKMNAKPYPYFDGGIMRVNVPGKYSHLVTSTSNLFSIADREVCVLLVSEQQFKVSATF